jgi:hypothetical protein
MPSFTIKLALFCRLFFCPLLRERVVSAGVEVVELELELELEVATAALAWSGCE